MHLASIALALLACRDERRRRSSAEPVVPQPADASLRELPASARASYVPPPRERWPCALDVDESQGIRVRGRSVFDYARTACRMPRALIAQGIWGCPSRFVRTDTDGMVRERTFEYDADGRLLKFDAGNFVQSFTWDGDRLSSVTRTGDPEPAAYVDQDVRVIAVDPSGRPQEVLVLDGERLAQLDEYLYGSVAAVATIEWHDERPREVRVDVRGPVLGSVTRQFRYDCPHAQ